MVGTGSTSGTGNSLDNIIAGNEGNNALYGLDGNDTLIGNGGNDLLDGGGGADIMASGTGNDAYVVDSLADTVTENELNNTLTGNSADNTLETDKKATPNNNWKSMGLTALQIPWTFCVTSVADREQGNCSRHKSALRFCHGRLSALPSRGRSTRHRRTEIGERGIGLSGGQRQRLAIARALLKRPRVLVFDEAVSNLDQQTAEHFARTINSLKGKVTMLFITHQVPAGLQVDEVFRLGGAPRMAEAGVQEKRNS